MTERYDNLDGLRALSCVAIIAMHIKANADYQIDSWLFQNVVAAWGHLVALFLMISGFGMFCGYYEKSKSGSIDLNNFYIKRYKKILPFFITLIVIDMVMDRSLGHVIQGITEATLVFGLLPNNQPEVIGVCWTLGVIFLFYCCSRLLFICVGTREEQSRLLLCPSLSAYSVPLISSRTSL